ncbi:MAG: serine/threonine protein kinase [Bacteriovorax sp.]|nr:serine/threonine protein kinase [Bacteriovorax sp.]
MSSNLWGSSKTQFFYELNPDLVLETLDHLGFKTTGRVMTMNSMENRVYEVEIESDSDNPSDHFKIIKFYRPGRWTKIQIQEEHDFLADLVEYEVPVIAPIAFPQFDGQTLFTLNDPELYYTVFNKQGGRAPDEFTNEEIEQVGRLLARLHNVGDMRTAPHRLRLTPDVYLKSNLDFLLDQKIIPSHLEASFKGVLEGIYDLTKNSFNNIHFQRIHGDCHLGNILKRGDVFHLIDFDDMVMGPAVQDMWLMLPGRDEYVDNLRNHMLDAYSTMRDFNFEEVRLTEVLRTLRMINYSAWIAKRFEDPAFKNAFPFFESPSYWEGQINDLRDQIYYLQEL